MHSLFKPLVLNLSCVLSAQDPGSCCDSEEEEEEEEVCSTERAGADQRYDEHMDEAAEEEGLKRYRDARANEMFPDEVDTPLDTPARIRSVAFLLCFLFLLHFLLGWNIYCFLFVWVAVLFSQVPALQGVKKFPLVTLGPHGKLAPRLFAYIPVPEL